MGVTCHWVGDNLHRKSAAIACRRLSGAHTYDKIAEMLGNIHTAFGLSLNEVVDTVTDNGFNFVKAFKTFRIQIHTFNVMEQTIEEQTKTENLDENVEETLFFPTTIDPDEETYISLPNHLRYASHTLSLIATHFKTYSCYVKMSNQHLMEESREAKVC